MDRIHWTRLKSRLKWFGKRVSNKMKDTLVKQGHVDTGKLRDSIKSYMESDAGKLYLYIEYLDYGKYAERWFKKDPEKKIRGKKGQIRIKTGIRDIPTFYDEGFNELEELNSVIEEATQKDLEMVVDDFIKKYK